MRPADFARVALVVSGVLLAGVAGAQGEDAPGANPVGGNPHNAGGMQVFEPPPDTTDEDPRLPAGSIDVTILDADNQPVPNVAVTLGIVHNSVAKGESREHKLGTADGSGHLAFSNLERGSGIAYRVSVGRDGGTFWASPFGLSERGTRVRLHVYPITHDIHQAMVVQRVAIYAEMKDDRVQIEEAITFFNLGRFAWVPEDVVIGLPENFTALNGQQMMGGEGIDPIEKRGAKLRGTFGPGQHPVEFRWQLPYGGDETVSFDESLPPNVAVMQIMAPASQQMKLVVPGFPDAEPRTDAQGERILITEKQLRRDDPPLTHVRVELRDLPTPGPARKIATAIAALGVLAGFAYAFTAHSASKPKAPGKERRTALLADLEELERSHQAGDIGPKTYERARRQLIDEIARTLASPAVT
ncbi:MAG TPA: hypothetical protein VGI39_42450 [Polyangiaceae bacterium]